MRERKDSYKILVGKPEISGPLARSRSKWKGIKTDFKDVGWEHSTGLMWHRMGVSWGALRFYKMLRISCVAERLAASQGKLTSNELVTATHYEVTVDGFLDWLLDLCFIGHLQFVTTNNCNTIDISTLYKTTLSLFQPTASSLVVAW
jgi:hypothetical protein